MKKKQIDASISKIGPKKFQCIVYNVAYNKEILVKYNDHDRVLTGTSLYRRQQAILTPRLPQASRLPPAPRLPSKRVECVKATDKEVIFHVSIYEKFLFISWFTFIVNLCKHLW